MTTALRQAALAIGLLALAPHPVPAQSQASAKSPAAGELVVAIAEVRCADAELGRIVTETLETELMQCDRIRVVASSRVRKAFESLSLAPDALSDPDDAAKLAAKLGATHVVTGSCFEREAHIVLNLRLIEGLTGVATRGGAAGAEGAKTEILPLVKRAAEEVLKRLALPAPASRAARDTRPEPAAPAHPNPKPAAPEDELSPLRALGLVPPSTKPGSTVTEKDLSDLVGKLAKGLGKDRDRTVAVEKPAAPAERVRVLAALARLALTAENVADRKGALLEGPPDEKNIPSWARPAVEAALDEGWWDEDRPLKPLEPATWSFVAALLDRMPLVELPAHAGAPIAEGTTGLVVDARDLEIQRSSNPRIIDEEGQVLYPDRAHVPNMDYLLRHGLAAYSDDEAKAPRAGARPVRVKALKTAGAGRDDFVVSKEDADRIRSEDKRSHFLWHWNVVVLVKGQAPPPAQPPSP